MLVYAWYIFDIIVVLVISFAANEKREFDK